MLKGMWDFTYKRYTSGNIGIKGKEVELVYGYDHAFMRKGKHPEVT